jgi:hypothetical protein
MKRLDELHIDNDEIYPMPRPGQEPPKPHTRPIRIDIIVEEDGSVEVTEFWAVRQDDGSVREVALLGKRPMKEGVTNVENAVHWLKENGYAVREFSIDPDARSPRKGYRAWKGNEPWAIRPAWRIQKMRKAVERRMQSFIQQNPGAPTSGLTFLDFAYDL